MTIEADSEREALLLARESFPEDRDFTITLHAQRCRKCRALVTEATAFRCEPCQARREARKRTFLVTARFMVRGAWTKGHLVRVRALGLAGATVQGVRQARREALRPGTRVEQARVEVVPVKKCS